MRDAELVSTEVLLAKPKRFVCEILRMPDGQEIDWYYSDVPESVMVVPVTDEGNVILVRQYRHNLKTDTLELPAGVASPGESMEAAALRELVEETGHTVLDPSYLVSLGRFYALPSETNKYVNFFLASPTHSRGAARGDTEIEKYFDMSTVVMPFNEALAAVGQSIHGIETAGALMLARRHLQPASVPLPASQGNYSGVWLSRYEYYSSGRDAAFTGQHYVVVLQHGARLSVRSLPGTAPGTLNMDLTADGNVITGTWTEETDPDGYYQGARYHGALQMLVEPTGRRMVGKWCGFGREMDVNTGPWELIFQSASTNKATLAKYDKPA